MMYNCLLASIRRFAWMRIVNFIKSIDRGLDLDGKSTSEIELTDICEMQVHYLLLSGIHGGNKLSKIQCNKRSSHLMITETHNLNE